MHLIKLSIKDSRNSMKFSKTQLLCQFTEWVEILLAIKIYPFYAPQHKKHQKLSTNHRVHK